jgi:hypothetical protein
VLSFEKSDGIIVRGCELYGSGTLGLVLTGVRNFTLGDSTLRDCTQGAIQAINSRNVNVIDSKITGNVAYPLFSFENTAPVQMAGCTISGNKGEAVFALDGRSDGLGLSGTRIENNEIDSFVGEKSAWPSLDNVSFTDNSFEDPTAGSQGDYSGGEGPDNEASPVMPTE